MEPEICTKMLKKMSEKPGAKFPATTPGCSMVKIGRLDDSFKDAGKPSRRSITAAKRKEKDKKERGKKSKIERPNVGHLFAPKFLFLHMPEQNVVKCDSSGKEG